MDSKLILVVVGVIAAAFGGSEAITCYECNSDTQSNCTDPFKPDGVPTCTGATCTKLFATNSGKTLVERSCSDARVDKDECIDVSTVEYKGEACVCRTDNCNDGQMVKPTSYNVVIGVAMATVTAYAWMNQI